MKRIIYHLLYLVLLSTYSLVSFAQSKNIQGTVSDKTGPLPGVSIIEKGLTTNGTTTDVNGKFRLALRGTSNILIIRAIGYIQKEVAVNAQRPISVTLEEDAQNLQEVVVVAYGQQKKVTVTGSVSTVSGVDIRQNPAASLQNALTGRLPGFFSQQRSGAPGSDGAAFFIRGISSYTGNNTPLILVDDIEYSAGQFARIDPNEIENISILKDASTTAVYGIKGANGVVLITTRRGQVGSPKLNFKSESSINQPTILPEYLGAYDAAIVRNQALVNDGLPAEFTQEDLDLFQSGADPYGHPDINWRKTLFKNFSLQQRNNLDISGGTEKVKYFLSTGYLYQNGMLKDFGSNSDVNNNFYHKRYNYRSNLDINVNKDLGIRLDLTGNIGEINKPIVGSPFGYNDVFYDYSSYLTLPPYAYPIYNPDGTFGYSTRQLQGGSYNVNNIVGRLSTYGYDRDFENNMNLVASANQKLNFLTKGLSLKGTVSYASTYGYRRTQNRVNGNFPSFIYDSKANTYTARDINSYRIPRFGLGYSAGGTTRTLNTQVILNYDRTFGDHHLYSLGLMNLNSKLNGEGGVNYSYIPNNFRGNSGRLGYDFRNKYLFQFNFGYNGTDRFVSSKRYGFFPAVSVGWNLSEEPFFKDNINFINRLKLRSSYGMVGSDNIGGFTYAYEQTYNRNGSASFGTQHNGYTGIAEGTLANNQVTWEKEKKFDGGVEMDFWKSRITTTIDFFDHNRYDILTTRGTVSAVFGQGLPPVNLGKVNNRGMEVEIAFKNSIGSEGSYFLKGNYSFAKNKITFQDEPSQKYPWLQSTGNSIGEILVYNWIGFYKDQQDIDSSPKPAVAAKPGDLKYADLNGDNIIDSYDMSYSAYPNLPNSNFGLSLGGSYKNFNFSVLFQAATNFNVRGTAEAIRLFSANTMPVHQQAWTPELGDNAKYPRLTAGNPGISDPGAYPSTFWMVSGNYLRLRNAEIGYSIPKGLVSKVKLESARIYVNGYNLLTWSKISERYQFDPEINSGTDRSNYPPQRMYNFGLLVGF